MQIFTSRICGRKLTVLASDCLLSSLYDVSSGQTVLLAQEGLSAYLAEAILNAYHLHRNRVVLDNNVSNSRTQTNLDLMVLSGYDSAALSSGVEDELLVERLPGEHIDDLGGDTLSSQLLLSSTDKVVDASVS